MGTEQQSPASRVERAFAAIAASRMAGLPLNNPALHVEACGLQPWNRLWLGVLVVPWAISLMLLPAGNPGFRRLGADERQRWAFPSGDYDFLGGEEGGLGAYQLCSLFSPAFEFSCQEDARHAAWAALDALMRPAAGDAAAARRERARLDGRSLHDAPQSRRTFLGGLLPRGEKT